MGPDYGVAGQPSVVGEVMCQRERQFLMLGDRVVEAAEESLTLYLTITYCKAAAFAGDFL